MKKIFTLFAGLLLASGSAFGQSKWTSVIKNGDLEGAADPLWSSFWCHDYRRGVEFDPESGQVYSDDDPENGQFQGFAEVVEDPANPANHCCKVIIRSEAEADEAGNKVTPEGQTSLASWDCQFFIYANEPIPEGKEVRMIIKVKGEKAGKFETQAHWTPGNYNHYVMFGDQNFGTEWTSITTDAVVVSADQSKEADGKFFQSVAFNLSTTTEGNVLYFDDIDLQVRDAKDPAEFEGWFNFLRNGTLSDDHPLKASPQYTTFTGRDGSDGVDRQARIVNDPIDGQPALTVSTVCWEGTDEIPEVDEEGNPVLDEDGNPVVKEEQYWYKHTTDAETGEEKTERTTTIDDWQSQFFVTIPHSFKAGEKFKVKYSVRADKPTTLDTQAHTQPGGYKQHNFIGTPDVTEEWQEFEYEGEISSEAKTATTIAFNCNKDKDEANNIYFRFEEFSVNAAEVMEDDRVLASGSAIGELPVKGSKDPLVMKVDLSDALAALGVNSVSALMEGTLKVPFVDDNEEVKWEEVQGDYYIDEKGYYTDQVGINIAYEEESTEGNVASFNVYNDNSDATKIDTKLVFGVAEDAAPAEGYARRVWNYMLDIQLLAADAYKEALGVEDVKTADKGANAIYDLSGRRVVKPAKGLYIQNSKKIFVK